MTLWIESEENSGSISGSTSVNTRRSLARAYSPGAIGISAGAIIEIIFGGGPWIFGLTNILTGAAYDARFSDKGGGDT